MDHIGNSLNRQVEEKLNIASSCQIDPAVIEHVLVDNSDLVPYKWRDRHAKLIQQKGVAFYEELAHRARKHGNPPKRLMAFFVGKEINKEPGE